MGAKNWQKMKQSLVQHFSMALLKLETQVWGTQSVTKYYCLGFIYGTSLKYFSNFFPEDFKKMIENMKMKTKPHPQLCLCVWVRPPFCISAPICDVGFDVINFVSILEKKNWILQFWLGAGSCASELQWKVKDWKWIVG